MHGEIREAEADDELDEGAEGEVRIQESGGEKTWRGSVWVHQLHK